MSENSDEDKPDMLRGYLNDVAKRVYGMHMKHVDELVAAFIVKHGIDPDDAEIVTSFDAGKFVWRTHIEKRRHQPEAPTLSCLPGEG